MVEIFLIMKNMQRCTILESHDLWVENSLFGKLGLLFWQYP
jgi:hypothetical protein